ncbi:hypothetical protein MHC_06005 [Mycoplasma haemocanis str. Illinois]|uniref:Uncharacterized protein n=1 Tax=Mycoplasma haemocanis (strain Illinois) TaxID=1111676 RepID=I6RDL3_MYCHN|nr:hypothetical protein MHC_06005 [Mycoplasma haemocanis str. Illinois]
MNAWVGKGLLTFISAAGVAGIGVYFGKIWNLL